MANGVDFVHDFECQWNEQVQRIKNQTTAQRIQALNEQIETFETFYGGSFQDLFGHLNDLEIDGMSEAVDLLDWKELVKERQRLLDMTFTEEPSENGGTQGEKRQDHPDTPFPHNP
ncbi:hypothetical protein [Alicyclobacillus shizuokensis]|uniref:hypothetical protein n=1 Tax=Alicyclobacillus shizuokensis TaxID=392014 RepID=UPI0008323DC8|nr:hypothetical protein [Alicyclobacillus shizuokensis]